MAFEKTPILNWRRHKPVNQVCSYCGFQPIAPSVCLGGYAFEKQGRFLLMEPTKWESCDGRHTVVER